MFTHIIREYYVLYLYTNSGCVQFSGVNMFPPVYYYKRVAQLFYFGLYLYHVEGLNKTL